MNATTKYAQRSTTPAEREFTLWLSFTPPQARSPMKRKTNHTSTEPTETEIQHAAYLLWIENGRPEGRDLEHWFAAKEMLLHRHGRDAKTRRAAAEISVSAPRHAAEKN
jgi:hypothetical protein